MILKHSCHRLYQKIDICQSERIAAINIGLACGVIVSHKKRISKRFNQLDNKLQIIIRKMSSFPLLLCLNKTNMFNYSTLLVAKICSSIMPMPNEIIPTYSTQLKNSNLKIVCVSAVYNTCSMKAATAKRPPYDILPMYVSAPAMCACVVSIARKLILVKKKNCSKMNENTTPMN